MVPGQMLGHYRIVERRGAGGMGVVYEALDTRLNRKVALKMLNVEATADPARRQRFIQEAQAASALDHPNIVTVYDIPEIDGQHCIVMQYVEGKTLGELMRRGPRAGTPLRTDDTLRYAVQIADALAQAHARNIVHRDLKPDNIMVTPDGQVKVLDFGLAKLIPSIDPEEGLTATLDRPLTDPGQIVGTVGYMSPEQAQGKRLDARTDIFSFGALLYEMTTGRRAFRGENRASILSAILRDDPERVSAISPAVPPELERIVIRALRKDPSRRWQSMADVRVALMEVKEESESGTSGPRVAAAPRSRKHVWAVLAVAALLVAAAGGWWRWRVLEDRQAHPMRSFPLTGTLEREIEPAFSPDGKQIAYAGAATELGRTHIYVKLIGAGAPLQLTNSELGADHDPAWSPDGRYLAFERYLAEGRDICLVPSLGGAERRLVTLHPGRTSNNGLSWSPDGKYLAVVAGVSERNDGDALDGIALLSVETGEQKMIARPPTGIFGYTTPVFSPDGKWIAFNNKRSGRNHDLFVQDEAATHAPRRLTSDERVISGLSWTPDGRSILFSSNRSGVPAIWSVALDGGAPERVQGTGENAIDPVVSPQGARLAYVQAISDTNIWRAPLDENHKSGEPVRIIASSRNDELAQYSADGKRIAFVSERSGSPEIWTSDADGANPRMITSFAAGTVSGPRFSPDGRQVVFDRPAEGYRQIFVMNADGGVPRRLTSDPTNLFNATWSRDGKWIYYWDAAVRPYQLSRIPAGGGPKIRITNNGAALAMESPDGKYLYYTKRPGTGLWRMPLGGGEEIEVDAEAIEPGWGVANDGIYLLRRNGNVDFLSFASGKLSPAAKGIGDEHQDVHQLTVSPDGRWLLYTRHDRNEATIQVVEGFR